MLMCIATHTCSTEFRMSLKVFQDKHYKIVKDLEEELVKARNLKEKRVLENYQKEYSKIQNEKG